MESGTNDPMAVFLTIALVELIASVTVPPASNLDLLTMFVKQMGLGAALGLLGGLMIVSVLNRLPLDRGLAPIFVLGLAMLIFLLHRGGGRQRLSGGLCRGHFCREQAHLRQGSDPPLPGWADLACADHHVPGAGSSGDTFAVPTILLPAIGLALFLIFVARPIAVWLSLLPFDFTQQEIGFVAWVGLRGAVSILLGIMPILGGIDDQHVFFNTAFIIVLVSLLLQGWTIRRWRNGWGSSFRENGRSGQGGTGPAGQGQSRTHFLPCHKDSPILRGERIPRWAMPRSSSAMGAACATNMPVGCGRTTRSICSSRPVILACLTGCLPAACRWTRMMRISSVPSPSRPRAREGTGCAYGPGLLTTAEQAMTVGDLMTYRLGGKVDYADRVRLGSIILIVRDLDEHEHVSSVGISLEPVEPATRLPIFINMREIAHRIRDLIRRYRGKRYPDRKIEGRKKATGLHRPAG